MFNTTVLFTGDMTMEAEEDLIARYPTQLKADILKVGHHGSATSTGISLNAVQPHISIISVGEYNSYHLPDSNVYQRLLKQSTVYMTKDTGNIDLYIHDQYWICPYRK